MIRRLQFPMVLRTSPSEGLERASCRCILTSQCPTSFSVPNQLLLCSEYQKSVKDFLWQEKLMMYWLLFAFCGISCFSCPVLESLTIEKLSNGFPSKFAETLGDTDLITYVYEGRRGMDNIEQTPITKLLFSVQMHEDGWSHVPRMARLKHEAEAETWELQLIVSTSSVPTKYYLVRPTVSIQQSRDPVHDFPYFDVTSFLPRRVPSRPRPWFLINNPELQELKQNRHFKRQATLSVEEIRSPEEALLFFGNRHNIDVVGTTPFWDLLFGSEPGRTPQLYMEDLPLSDHTLDEKLQCSFGKYLQSGSRRTQVVA
jgi:hypothetical protein